MKKTNSIQLESIVISEIKKLSPSRKYTITSPLFYEGQIPVVAYLILNGCVQLLKNKQIKKILKPGSLIGLSELMNNSPSNLSAEVKAESTLCFLDKSTILEVINEKNSILADLFIKEKQ